MLHMRFNQLVDPNNHQKGLTAKGLSSFNCQFIYEETNLEGDAVQMKSSNSNPGRLVLYLEKRHFINTVNISIEEESSVNYQLKLLAQLLLVVTQGNHQG